MATIDNAYGKGVVYTAPIDLGSMAPLDSRIAVQTVAERDAHITGNRAYVGMQVYVADDEKTYIYNGSTWDVLVTDADLTEGIDVKIAAATTGKIGGILSGADVEVDTDGNATVKQADKLRTPRNVALTGDATATGTFDGSADLTLTVDVPGLDTKVNITGQTGDVDLTGATVKVKTLSKSEAQSSADKTEVASIGFVSDVVDARIAQSDAMIYKGTIADATTLEGVNSTAKTGWTYRVTADIDFTGKDYIISDVKEAHTGDLIICRTDGSEGTAATWDIVKHNDDGQIIGPESSVADRIVTFADGTGKVVKDSGKTLDDISSEIDSDVSAAKTELIGTSSSASSTDTIYGAKKYADEILATLEEAVLKNVSIPTPSGDKAPSVSIADNTATITLPAYALASTVTALTSRVAANEAKLVGITTVTGYVGTEIANAKTALIGTDSDEATADTIKGAKKYADAVAGDLTTLEGRVDGLETEIDANTGKLAGLTETTVVGEINAKITAGVADGGVIDNRIDAVISTAIGTSGSIETWADARYIQETEVFTIEDSEILALFTGSQG